MTSLKAHPPLRVDTPLQYVKGVGPARAEVFAAAGLRTVGDLLEYFPYRYEFRSGEMDIADLEPGLIATVRGEAIRLGGRPPMRTCELQNGTDTIKLRWFQGLPSGTRLWPGSTVIATGPVREFDGELEMVQPQIEVFEPGQPVRTDRVAAELVGVYPMSGKLTSPLVRRTIQTILALGAPEPAVDALPPRLRARHGLPTRADAIHQMHRPKDEGAAAAARRRLAYEELLLMELAMALRRRRALSIQKCPKIRVTAEIDRRIRARFPFTLTDAQNAVVREIARDLESGRPMIRLLQGDVGSGKTVVALYACLAAVATRLQAAIMAPTELLARQHFRNIEQYLEGSRVRRLLLSGGGRPKSRRQNLETIERGEIDLVVGTQALVQRDVAFSNLGLVVVDEQHKFGVLQRHEFRTKGLGPHYLVMTATPIPRTLAMTVFGDLDVSTLKQSPPGRGTIITRVVPRSKWATVMQYVRGRIEAGEQAYVVCPLVGEEEAAGEESAENSVQNAENRHEGTKARRHEGEGSESSVQGSAAESQRSAFGVQRSAFGVQRSSNPDSGLRAQHSAPRDSPIDAGVVSVKEVYEKLISGPWAGLRVAMLHGSMPSDQKERTIREFSDGKLHAVVATTVIEVGVDVPSATIMIVENADRFGLSQLHQLRGRIGRGSRDGLCVLIAYARGAKSAERLNVLAQTTDGFRIAEADLRLRGPGELFGTRQHGLPDLRIASLIDDFELLEKARQDAFEIVDSDPTLRRPEHAGLVAPMRRLFGEKMALIDAG